MLKEMGSVYHVKNPGYSLQLNSEIKCQYSIWFCKCNSVYKKVAFSTKNIDVGCANSGRAIISIFVMSALETCHNAQTQVMNDSMRATGSKTILVYHCSLVPLTAKISLAAKLTTGKPPSMYPQERKKVNTHSKPKLTGLNIFNSVRAAVHGTQVRMMSTSTPWTAFVHRAELALQFSIMDYKEGCASLLQSSMDPMRDISGYVSETKKDAKPQDLKCFINQVYLVPSSQKKKKELKLKSK
eukprot:jgi/Psemu1/8824/gm1.8824_g